VSDSQTYCEFTDACGNRCSTRTAIFTCGTLFFVSVASLSTSSAVPFACLPWPYAFTFADGVKTAHQQEISSASVTVVLLLSSLVPAEDADYSTRFVTKSLHGATSSSGNW
jgi:hypothetical protein